MKNALTAAFALLMLLCTGALQPASARIITYMPAINVGLPDAAVINIDLSASPPACSYPFGMYARCPDYRNDFYAGQPCSNVVLPAASIIMQ